MSPDRKQAQAGLSVTTLMIASASSLVAAMLVSKLWGPGTLFSAAATPVIVALVSEGLRRPVRVIGTVRDTRATRFDPLAEGRRGLHEGDLERARPLMPAAAVAERRVHTASSRTGFVRLPRPRVIAAIATGIVAFVLAGVLLTSSELVLGKSVVSSAHRTTYIPVKRSTSDTKKTDTQDTTSTPATNTTTTPPPPKATTGATEPPPSETTPTAPPAATTPAPGATTAPPAGAAPTTAAPATPAAPGATPPSSTTP